MSEASRPERPVLIQKKYRGNEYRLINNDGYGRRKMNIFLQKIQTADIGEKGTDTNDKIPRKFLAHGPEMEKCFS